MGDPRRPKIHGSIRVGAGSFLSRRLPNTYARQSDPQPQPDDDRLRRRRIRRDAHRGGTRGDRGSPSAWGEHRHGLHKTGRAQPRECGEIGRRPPLAGRRRGRNASENQRPRSGGQHLLHVCKRSRGWPKQGRSLPGWRQHAIPHPLSRRAARHHLRIHRVLRGHHADTLRTSWRSPAVRT